MITAETMRARYNPLKEVLELISHERALLYRDFLKEQVPEATAEELRKLGFTVGGINKHMVRVSWEGKR